MNINVTQHNCHFIVKPEARKVICILQVDPMLLERYIKDADNTYLFSWDKRLRERAKLPYRYVGIASCATEDTWNEDTGKLIAYHKAKTKFCHTFFRVANNVFDYFDSVLNDIMDSCNALGGVWNRNLGAVQEKIKHRIGDEDPLWEPANK